MLTADIHALSNIKLQVTQNLECGFYLGVVCIFTSTLENITVYLLVFIVTDRCHEVPDKRIGTSGNKNHNRKTIVYVCFGGWGVSCDPKHCDLKGAWYRPQPPQSVQAANPKGDYSQINCMIPLECFPIMAITPRVSSHGAPYRKTILSTRNGIFSLLFLFLFQIR